jgi:hypothetical protein
VAVAPEGCCRSAIDDGRIGEQSRALLMESWGRSVRSARNQQARTMGCQNAISIGSARDRFRWRPHKQRLTLLDALRGLGYCYQQPSSRSLSASRAASFRDHV